MKPRQSPPLARWIAHLLIPRSEREFILGDLEELHAARAERHGRSAADGRYWRDTLSLVTLRLRRASTSLPARRLSHARSSNMLRDLGADLTSALRALRRQPGFSALTILTLALGVGSTAAVFGMANQLLFRPLPGIGEPDGAAYLQFRSISEPESTQGRGIALPDFRPDRAEPLLGGDRVLHRRRGGAAAECGRGA